MSSCLAFGISASLSLHGVWVFALILVIVFPLLDSFLYSRLQSTKQIYVWNIAALWALTIGCIRLIHKGGQTLADFGLRFGTFPRTLFVSGVLVLLVLVLVLVQKLQTKKPDADRLCKATEKLRKMLPVTGTERMLWIVLSITAGFCEEFLYRGWLLRISSQHSIWIGLLVSSICFGLAHSYQGRSGIVGTGVLGLFFGGVFITSGCLLPGQMLHTVMDINNGLAISRAVNRADPAQP